MRGIFLVWAMLVNVAAIADDQQPATMTPSDTLAWVQDGGPPFAVAWSDDDGAHGRFVRFPAGFSKSADGVDGVDATPTILPSQ